MILAVCIDDQNGLMFNGRRVSSDKAVVQDIMKLSDVLWISPYSQRLFSNYLDRVVVSESCFSDQCEILFAESGDFLQIKDKVHMLVVYKWNRRYPSDETFPLELYTADMTLKHTEDFEGFSHPRITKEVYVR